MERAGAYKHAAALYSFSELGPRYALADDRICPKLGSTVVEQINSTRTVNKK